MKKRTLTLFLILALVCALLPTAAFAAEEDVVAYPVEGGNIYFDPTTGTVIGTGEAITVVDIPEEIDGVAVTSIREYAFFNCDSLTSIVIPDSVTSIEDGAFAGCDSLTSIVIPGSVTSIGNKAFNGCARLASIVIPNSVTSIEDWAFAGCDSLTSIVIPDSVTSIGDNAFSWCFSLTDIVIPNSVTSIGDNAFSGCYSLASVTVENPNCDIYASHHTLGNPDEPYGTVEGNVVIVTFEGLTVLHGYSGSTVEAYANEYGYEFVPLDGKPEPTDPKPTEPTPTDPKPSNPTPSTPAVTNPFTDLKATAYYYQPVQWAYANNITAGTSASTFSPEQGCTRAQVVSFLWRAAGSPKPASSSNPFTDVKAGSYYYDAVLWAAEKGITAGTSATTFSPNARVTRSQFVTFLYRFAGSSDVGGVKNPFNDLNTKAFYCNAVLWAVENGITAGTSATTFSPEATCTRGQVVSFLYRYFN